jgi:hypothetical protein
VSDWVRCSCFAASLSGLVSAAQRRPMSTERAHRRISWAPRAAAHSPAPTAAWQEHGFSSSSNLDARGAQRLPPIGAALSEVALRTRASPAGVERQTSPHGPRRLGHRRLWVAQTHPNRPVSARISRRSPAADLACQSHFYVSFASCALFLRSERSAVRIGPGALQKCRQMSGFPQGHPLRLRLPQARPLAALRAPLSRRA